MWVIILSIPSRTYLHLQQFNAHLMTRLHKILQINITFLNTYLTTSFLWTYFCTQKFEPFLFVYVRMHTKLEQPKKLQIWICFKIMSFCPYEVPMTKSTKLSLKNSPVARILLAASEKCITRCQCCKSPFCNEMV